MFVLLPKMRNVGPQFASGVTNVGFRPDCVTRAKANMNATSATTTIICRNVNLARGSLMGVASTGLPAKKAGSTSSVPKRCRRKFLSIESRSDDPNEGLRHYRFFSCKTTPLRSDDHRFRRRSPRSCYSLRRLVSRSERRKRGSDSYPLEKTGSRFGAGFDRADSLQFGRDPCHLGSR
jgi:hypothetical protein